MKNEFVPYDIALAMKELGFDEPCFGYYITKGHPPTINEIRNGKSFDFEDSDGCLAPLYQQVFRWIYENYKDNDSVEDFYEENTLSWRLHTEHMEMKLRKLIEIVKEKRDGNT